nr:hypothetical protein [Herbaspirillum sp. ASV7]
MIKRADTMEKGMHGSGHRRYTWSAPGFGRKYKTMAVGGQHNKIDIRSAAMPEPVWLYQGNKMKIGEIDGRRLSMSRVSGGMRSVATVICKAC